MSVKTTIDPEALQAIKTLLGAQGFIDEPAEMQPYLVSWRNNWTGKSPLIALPANTEQVAGIMEVCHRHRIAIVPQGGNTGLVGGNIPSMEGNQLVVNLSRMNKIRAIDTTGSTITVEAGVILQASQEKAAEAGFLFPLSMASEGSAQIGGAISTNAGGTAVLRYGMMRDLVLGTETVLADGRILSSLGKLPKDNTGYNLGQYFIGAEGTLGIITAATLKLFPAPAQNLVAFVALPDVETALELLSDFRNETGEYLTAFEIMSLAALQLVMKHIPESRFPVKDDAPYYLLVELSASSHTVPLRTLFEKLASKALEDQKISDAAIAESLAQAKKFWHLRESISEALRKQGARLHFDISLPLGQIADFLRETEPKIKAIAPNTVLAPFGHIGDGNLHYNMYFSGAGDLDAATKKQIQHLVYSEVARRGGSISAEHGIGIERKAELLLYKQPEALALMKTIKYALDPSGIMNPGKIFD